MSVTSDFAKELNKLRSESSSGKITANGSTRGRTGSVSSDFHTELKRLKSQGSTLVPGSTKRHNVTSRVASRLTTGEKEEEEEPSWFQKGLLEDGWDFGDIAKTILGTGADALEDIGAGIAEFPELFIDAMATIAPYFAKSQLNQAAYNTMNTDLLENAKKYDLEAEKKKADEFVAKDLYDSKAVAHSVLNPVTDGASAIIGQDYENVSVLGEKADSTVQSGGQMLATMGLQAVGVPWFVTTGVTAYGAEAENALNQGATHEEAMGSAAISAAAEILTEKLSGGIKFGGKAADDALTAMIARGISNKLGRTVARLGVDFAGEASEELISEIASNLGSALYRLDEESWQEILTSEEAMQGYLDAMIGGGLMGSVSGGFKAINSTVKGKDYVTELTKNEQKVVDAVYKKRLAEESKKGKVDKSKLYDKVIEDMDKGYITTDEIESALGGDAYDSYLDLKAESDEFKTLYETESGKLSEKQKDRLAELKEKNKAKSYEEALKEAQSQISENVANLVKGDRLVESYNEKARAYQDFEADFDKYKGTKYEDAAKKTLENAVKAGASNTNRIHDFVDMVAQSSADTGLTFDFKSGEQIKADFIARQQKNIAELENLTNRTDEQTKKLESLKDLLAKVESGEVVVDGDITDNGIVLNMDSPKPLNRTVGHEVTHSLEQSKHYKELHDSLFAYAKSKGIDIDAELESRKLKYEGVKDADPEAELVADLVGDFLFTDADYVKHLSTENQNLFQKLWNEIKHLCKMATAGSKEARELERVRKAFEDAYREGSKARTETKYSLNYTTDNRAVATIDSDIFDGKFDELTESERVKIVKNAIKGFRPGIPVSGRMINITRKSAEHFTNSDYTDKLRNKEPALYEDKLNIARNIDDVVYASTDYINEGLKHPRKDNITQFARGTVLLDIGGNKYEANVLVGYTTMQEMVLYDVQDLTPTTFKIKEKKTQPTLAGNESDTSKTVASSFDNSIAEKGENVNYSLSDSNGRQLSEEQSEYFKDSKVRDENGSLKVMYHGTPNGSFTVFKDGTYFTDSKEYADRYQNPSASSISTGKVASNPKTFEVYLDIKKPFDINDAEAREIYINDYIKGGNAMGINPYLSDAEYAKINSIDWTEGEDLRDFLIENEYDYDGLVLDEGGTGGYGDEVQSRGTSYVVFSPEQVKNVDNLKPSSDPDIRYSLSESSTYAEITEEQQKLFQRERQLEERKREAANNPELLQAMDDYSSLFTEMRPLIAKKRQGMATQAELDRIEEIKKLREVCMNRVTELQESLGLNAIAQEETEIREKKEELRVASDAAWAREGAEKENKAIAKSGLSAPEFFRKKALKAFKTTSNFNEAGYMLPDGKLLNFSGGERNHRYRDHREIGEIYEATNGVAALNRFLSDGNIRIMAESPGIDLASGVEPTKEQYAALRKFINTNGVKDGQFFVDFSDTDGRNTGKYSYNGKVIADRIINDIKYFYQTGTVRESSGLTDFLSLSNADEDFAPTSDFDVYGRDFLKKQEANEEDIAPVAENATTTPTVSKTETVAPKTYQEHPAALYGMRSGKNGWGEIYATAQEALNDAVRHTNNDLWDAFNKEIDEAPQNKALPRGSTPIINALIAVQEDVRQETITPMQGAHLLSEMYNQGGVRLLGSLYNPKTGNLYDKVLEKAKQYESVTPVANPDPTAPYWFSEEIAKVVDELSTQDVNDPVYGKMDVFDIRGYTIQRRSLKDGKRWHYSIISPGGTSRYNIIEADKNAFYGDVAEKLESIMRIDFSDAFEQQKPGAVPADAPVRVVSTEDGDYLKSGSFDDVKKAESKRAKILTEMPDQKTKQVKKADSVNVDKETTDGKKSPLKMIEEYFIDNGFVFEKLSKKTKNRELEAKWDGIRRTRSAAQHLIGKGVDGVKSLKSMVETVEQAGLTEDFYNYLGHYRNIDGMTLNTRFNTYNRGVWGDVSAAESQFEADRLERLHPEFKAWAEDVYAYNTYLRDMMVKGGLISQRTADLLTEMYPHYVPIRRVGKDSSLEVEDTIGVGVKSPLKSATGGNADIEPLFNTMAERTMEVYRSVAMNNFGMELYNTLYPGRLNANASLAPGVSGVGMATGDVDVDYSIDGFDPREELLQSGKPGSLPTFSIFMNGERHTFDITSEMYTAMKPTSDFLSMKIPVLSGVSNLRRNLITAYSPWFTLNNAVKDLQEVIINSQHPLKTYATIRRAISEIAGKGQMYQEYVANGGEQNSYFDTEDSSFDPNKGVLDYLENKTGLKYILKANNIIEMLPRLSEYIASREDGRSVEVSMLDAARVTTNFGAGGKFTKLLDRNGCTFLNSSVQGFTQQARNIVEAKQNGLKGWASLAARYVAAGLPAALLNSFIWDDDEEYHDLPDYITNNYYIVAKYGDGQFVRIPKGRTAAVLGNAIEQVAKQSSGDDEADWNEFFKIFMENIAPNNPLDDNVFAPIKQVMTDTTWYGEDIVPYRLKDLPESEQFDEKTDDISIWLGEKLDYSPKKINYLIDQYSGVLGDTFLPMMTPKAESPIDNPLLKLAAPLRDRFTTDSVLNNRVTGDFYETLESAEKQAESGTPEDKFKSDLLITYNTEISKLMQEQRDIQTSDLKDSEKYKKNREIKKKINALQEKGLEALEDYSIDGVYAEAGGKRFNFGYDTENQKDRWFEIKPKKSDGEDNWYYQQEQAITKDLGIGYSEYWNNREMYDDFYYVASGYDKESGDDDIIESARSVFGYERFAEYASVLKTLKADYDKNGEVIPYSKFNKVKDYVNSLDIPKIEKKVLMKMLYPNGKKNNYAIVKYLDEREDISYDEFMTILDELGYKVDNKGYVTW